MFRNKYLQRCWHTCVATNLCKCVGEHVLQHICATLLANMFCNKYLQRCWQTCFATKFCNDYDKRVLQQIFAHMLEHMCCNKSLQLFWPTCFATDLTLSSTYSKATGNMQTVQFPSSSDTTWRVTPTGLIHLGEWCCS